MRAPNATRDPVFEASAKCPAYVIPDEVADAVRQKQQEDDAEMARLVAKGTPVARLNTGIDGGMNKVFAAAVPDGNTGLSESAEPQGFSLSHTRLPGTIPMDHVNPPHAPSDNLLAGVPEQPKIAAVPATTPATQPQPQTQVASAAPAEQSGGFFSNLARKVGLSSAAAADTTASAAPPPPQPAPTKPKAAADARHPAKSDTKQAAAKPALKPSVTDTSPATAAPAPAAQSFAGAQPIVSSNSFDSRFSATK